MLTYLFRCLYVGKRVLDLYGKEIGRGGYDECWPLPAGELKRAVLDAHSDACHFQAGRTPRSTPTAATRPARPTWLRSGRSTTTSPA